MSDIDHYLDAFTQELVEHLPKEEPGLSSRLNLLQEYIIRDKRTITIYISHSDPETATAVTRVTYTMPVPELTSPLFEVERAVIPPVGPHFRHFNDLGGRTAEEFVEMNSATIAGAANWFSEESRLKARLHEDIEEPIKITIRNILSYWRYMISMVYNAIHAARIRIPRSSSGRIRPRTASKRSSTRSTVASNAKSQRSTSRSRIGSSGRRSSPRPNSLSNHQSDPKPVAD